MSELILIRYGQSLWNAANKFTGMELDNLEPEKVPGLELDTGVPIVYTMSASSTVLQKEVLRK